MIAVFAILIFSACIVLFFPFDPKEKKEEQKSAKYATQVKKMWQIAQVSMKERKPFRAEKALLAILKIDEKNAAAYNRLGILYAKAKKYDEAVECFEIAQSLDNNPASVHNVGLIYLETGAYEKAEMAFLQAIEMEGDVPSRYIALAKTEEQLGNYKKAIEALESAQELSPSVATLRQILAIYENIGDASAAAMTAARIEDQIIEDNKLKEKKVEKVKRTSLKAKAAPKKVVSAKRAVSMPAGGEPRRVVRRMVRKSAVKPAEKSAGASVVRAKAAAKASVGGVAKVKTAPKIIKNHVGRKRI